MELLIFGTYLYSAQKSKRPFCFQSERCRQRLEGLFFENLFDSIPSVRQGGALSIANLVRAYGLTDDILIKMNERLDGVQHQPASSGGTGGGDVDSTQSLGQFGVAKRFRDNDFALHEDQVMYSCGKLFINTTDVNFS